MRQVRFGEELRRLRRERGLSLAGLARLTHYSRGHLNNVERGVRSPGRDLARSCDTALASEGILEKMLLAMEEDAAPPYVPFQLPPITSAFVGRAAELAALDIHLREGGAPGRPRVVVVHGATGMGKTECALQWAHRAREEFPDGVLFVDFAAFEEDGSLDPTRVLAALLDGLGVPASRVPAARPARAGLLRSLLHERRMLVLLDGVRNSADVRDALPGAEGCFVLITSRHRLTGLVAREGAGELALGPLRDEHAVELLRRLLPTADRGIGAPSHLHLIERLARRCGRQPLALRLAAAQVCSGTFTLHELADVAPMVPLLCSESASRG